MVNKDKKIELNEGRVISNGKLHYGGFPRKLIENEDPFVAARDRRRSAGEALVNSIYKIDPKAEPEKRKKYAETMNSFLSGKKELADELLAMGADPENVDAVVDWSSNPEFVKRDKEEIQKQAGERITKEREELARDKRGYTGD